MTVNIIDVMLIPFEKAENFIETGKINSYDLNLIKEDDHIFHAIYDQTNDKIWYLENERHGSPGAILEGIEYGIRSCGATLNYIEKVIILPKTINYNYIYDKEFILHILKEKLNN